METLTEILTRALTTREQTARARNAPKHVNVQQSHEATAPASCSSSSTVLVMRRNEGREQEEKMRRNWTWRTRDRWGTRKAIREWQLDAGAWAWYVLVSVARDERGWNCLRAWQRRQAPRATRQLEAGYTAGRVPDIPPQSHCWAAIRQTTPSNSRIWFLFILANLCSSTHRSFVCVPIGNLLVFCVFSING